MRSDLVADVDAITRSLDALQAELDNMKHLKQSGTKSAEPAERAVSRIAGIVMDIKAANRMIQAKNDSGRERAAEAKRATDLWHLKLQSINYQIHHFATKIEQCQELTSTVDTIDLVSTEEFEKTAPPQFAVDPTDPDREHRLLFNRLQFELHQRRQLVEYRDNLKKSKHDLSDQINKREQNLDSLRRDLSGITESIRPLESVLNIHPVTRQGNLGRTNALPAPLFAIFHQLTDFKLSRDDAGINVDIDGNEERVRADGAQSDASSDEDDAGINRLKKRKRSLVTKSNLRVRLSVADDSKRGSGEKKSLSIVFSMIRVPSAMKIAGIEGRYVVGVTEHSGKQNLIHDLFGPDPLLPTFPEKLRDANAYTWAQIMGGTVPTPMSPSTQKSRIYATELIRRLRSRNETQPMLRSQLEYLTRGTIPIPPALPAFPLPAETKLKDFVEVTGDAAISRKFRAVLAHPDANVELEASIELSPEYPLRAPLFTLKFLMHPDKDLDHHINHLHNMAREVNCQVLAFTPPRDENMTLAYQIRQLQMLLDIYVKTELREGDVGSRLSIRSAFGRDRQKPFVFNRSSRMFEDRRD